MTPMAWMVGQIERAAEGCLPAESVIQAPVLREVYELFHRHGVMTTDELAAALEVPYDRARRRIYRAVDAGLIERVQHCAEPAKYVRNAQFRLRGMR